MIKIGIIGTGYWGKHHLRVFSKLTCELIGISDLDPAKKKLADEYNVKFYTDFRKLVKRVDAIIIVTPPSTHFKIARYALKKNKNVFIEKPFVISKKEAEILIKLSKQRNTTLMIGHIYMYHPAVSHLKKIIKNKELGDIYYVISKRLNLGIVRSDVNSLWNFAPHDLSIITYLLSENPLQVSCFGQSYLQKNVEDVTFATLKFPGKVMAHLILSWLHPAKVRELTIVGSNKMAIFDDTDTKSPLKIFDKGIDFRKNDKNREWGNFGEFKMITRFGDVYTPRLDTKEPLELEALHFLRCIEKQEIPLSDGINGYNVLVVLDACTKSLKKGGKSIVVKYKNI